LILACCLLCLAQGLLVGWLVHRGTQRSFERFVREGAISQFRAAAIEHWTERGSWDGFGDRLHAGGPLGTPPPMPDGRGAPPFAGPERQAIGAADGPRRNASSGGWNRELPPGMRPPARPPRYGLVDGAGTVVVSEGVHPEGTRVDRTTHDAALPLLIDGVERRARPDASAPARSRLAGTLVPRSVRSRPDDRQRRRACCSRSPSAPGWRPPTPGRCAR
jgi:hypothetical protein